MESKDLCEKKVDLTPCHDSFFDLQFQQIASKHFSEKDLTNSGVIQLLSSMQKSYMSQIIRIEANMDYYELIMKQLNAKCLKDIKNTEFTPKTVVYQGVEGAWSSVAAKEMYPGIDILNVPKFKDVFENVSRNKDTVGIMPIDNSTAGAVTEV